MVRDIKGVWIEEFMHEVILKDVFICWFRLASTMSEWNVGVDR